MKLTTLSLAAASVLALSACGYNQGDRALSGAGLGAAGGAAIGCGDRRQPADRRVDRWRRRRRDGALTKPSDVDLGRPVWKR